MGVGGDDFEARTLRVNASMATMMMIAKFIE